MLFKNFYVFTAVLISAFNCGNETANNVHTFINESPAVNENKINASDISFEKKFDNIKVLNGDVFIDDASRGGYFHLTEDAALKDDYGMVFPANEKGKDWHWVRKYNDGDPVSIKFYGAKGIGVDGYKEDVAALRKAIDFVRSKGGGKVYIPASSSFYAFAGNGILLPDNIEIYGDGPASAIKNVNPESGVYCNGAIFFTTTYGPVNGLSIVRDPSYPIQDATKGQNFVIVQNSSDLSNLSVGKLIGLGANFFNKNQNIDNKSRYGNFEINKITQIQGNKIYLKYPLSLSLSKAAAANSATEKTGRVSPVIVDVNGDHTVNPKLNIKDRISQNVYIHDLSLSQADYNMIDNKPYAATENPAPVIALGGTFESRYKNLTIESFGTFGGNLFNRCDIGNLKIFSVRKLTDLGYGSANTKFHDIVWQYKASKITDTDPRGFVYLNDGTHDIEMYNIKASGNWDGNNLFVINGGAHNINIHDLEIDLPNLDNANSVAILIKDDNKITYTHDVTFRNVVINLNGIKKFLQVDGTQQVQEDRKLLFDNISFNGKVYSKDGSAITVSNSPAVTLNKIKMSHGNIALDNVQSAVITNLDAPQSDIINKRGNTKKLQLVGSKYRSLKNNNNN
jgi:hypothetical protein